MHLSFSLRVGRPNDHDDNEDDDDDYQAKPHQLFIGVLLILVGFGEVVRPLLQLGFGAFHVRSGDLELDSLG